MEVEVDKDTLLVILKRAEALVLFDWLARFNDRDDNTFEDQAEEHVLFDLEAVLEKSLDEVLSSKYRDSVALSRELVRDATD